MSNAELPERMCIHCGRSGADNPTYCGKQRGLQKCVFLAVQDDTARIRTAALNDTWATVESTCGFCGNKVRHVCTAFLKGSEHAAPTPSEDGAENPSIDDAVAKYNGGGPTELNER